VQHRPAALSARWMQRIWVWAHRTCRRACGHGGAVACVFVARKWSEKGCKTLHAVWRLVRDEMDVHVWRHKGIGEHMGIGEGWMGLLCRTCAASCALHL